MVNQRYWQLWYYLLHPADRRPTGSTPGGTLAALALGSLQAAAPR